MTNKTIVGPEEDDPRIEACYQRIVRILEQARAVIATHIDNTRVEAYWKIGREIVEEEQEGAERANYGTFLMQRIGKKLSQEEGRGFSVSLLRRIRQFYLAYPKGAALRRELENQHKNKDLEKRAAPRRVSSSETSDWPLSWSHYRTLIALDNLSRRRFYEIEAIKNQWSGRELEGMVQKMVFLGSNRHSDAQPI